MKNKSRYPRVKAQGLGYKVKGVRHKKEDATGEIHYHKVKKKAKA